VSKDTPLPTLQAAMDELALKVESLYRQLYAAEQLIQELERQRDQARALAMAYLKRGYKK
jgi:hypothetical protein